MLCPFVCVDICCCMKITECDNMPSIIIIHRLAKHLSSSAAVATSTAGVISTSIFTSVLHRYFERSRNFHLWKFRSISRFSFCQPSTVVDAGMLIAGVLVFRVTRVCGRLAFGKHNSSGSSRRRRRHTNHLGNLNENNYISCKMV